MSFSLSNKIWSLRSTEQRALEAFCQRFNLTEVSARILVGRGLDLHTAHDVLSPTLRALLPNPSVLKGMDQAVRRLLDARVGKEKIGIIGDYDVDGATSTAVLCRFLKQVGYQVEFYIPDRVKEGYGPNVVAFQKLKEKNCQVIFTLDCGTTSFDPLSSAKTMGLDVIVIDHHVAEAKLPNAYAIINPNRIDEGDDTREALGGCAAVGITFLFIVALNRSLRKDGVFGMGGQEPDLFQFLDLVALGTVCDVMPLTGLNRAFVTQGLKVLAQRRNLGLTALADSAGLDEKPTAYHLGFVLGPRINAGGRIGDSSLGARLLTTSLASEAKDISEKLEKLNSERKGIETAVLDEATDQAQTQIKAEANSLVLSGEGWHEGVIGIVAGRIKDQWNKPTCVISIHGEEAKGSARSIPGFDFGSFVHGMCHRTIIAKGGGHAMAAGFSLHRSKISELQSELNDAIHRVLKESTLMPVIKLDGHLSLGAVTPHVAFELEKMAPYGVGFPTPKFLFEDVIVTYAKVVGQNHIRLSLKQLGSPVIQAIAFRCVGTPLGDALLKRCGDALDLVGGLKLDQWGGEARAQLVVEDARYSQIQTVTQHAS